MLEVRVVARGRPRGPDPTHSLRRLLRLLLLLALLCGVLTAPAHAAGGAGLPVRTTITHASAATRGNPLGGRAMWIWELPRSDGGSLSAIIAASHRFGLSTLIIKSADGTSLWSQFNRSLVSALHANGIRVCA